MPLTMVLWWDPSRVPTYDNFAWMMGLSYFGGV